MTKLWNFLFGIEPERTEVEFDEPLVEPLVEPIIEPMETLEPGFKPATSGIRSETHWGDPRPWDPAMTNTLWDDESEPVWDHSISLWVRIRMEKWLARRMAALA